MSSRTWSDSTTTRNPIVTQSTPVKSQHANNITPFHIGDKITLQNQSLAGTIRYIGATDFKAGTWIGIELEKIGAGKNDGSIQGKRYFVCPPNTGLFILATKLAKQQQCHDRPSTPYQKVKSNIKTSTLPSLPPPVPKKEPSALEKRIQELELENKQLKQTMNACEAKNKNLKKTSMESIEILGKMLQSQYEKVQLLNKKNQDLYVETEELKKASLDAIESYETSLKSWEKEKSEIIQSHQHTVDRYQKDITVLEYILKKKAIKESDLIELIRKERHYNSKLSRELKSLKHQYENATRWSYNRVLDRLDTPIEEDEDCDENKKCPLCNQLGHSLLHCQLV